MSNLEQTSELKQMIHNHLLEVSDPCSFHFSFFFLFNSNYDYMKLFIRCIVHSLPSIRFLQCE